MKLIALFAATGALMMGQEAKMATAPLPVKVPTERPLTDLEVAKMQNYMLQIDRLQKEFKIQEFNEKVKPFSTAQQAQYAEACHSIGLTDAEIAAQVCGYNVGVDLDGKPILGPDGKPTPAKVWRITPPASLPGPVSSAPPEKK
jgi:hypothetical protein